MKKRGFGEGFWNGVGGKVRAEETIAAAAHREAHEEIDIHLSEASQVALLHFYFPDEPDKKDWNQDVHVFLITKWKGIPQETEEMRPKWFGITRLPFEAMWPDDPFWLPKILEGESVEAWFSFNKDNQISDYKIKNVDKSRKVFSKR